MGRSGYAIPIPVIERLREQAPNLAGLKVSDLPFEAVKPYLLDGLDVFIGQEPLFLEGAAAGAVGSVSGLASAWPEVVARLVHDGDKQAHERVLALRDATAGVPFIGALKAVLADRGRADVGRCTPTTPPSDRSRAGDPCPLDRVGHLPARHGLGHRR